MSKNNTHNVALIFKKWKPFMHLLVPFVQKRDPNVVHVAVHNAMGGSCLMSKWMTKPVSFQDLCDHFLRRKMGVDLFWDAKCKKEWNHEPLKSSSTLFGVVNDTAWIRMGLVYLGWPLFTAKHYLKKLLRGDSLCGDFLVWLLLGGPLESHRPQVIQTDSWTTRHEFNPPWHLYSGDNTVLGRLEFTEGKFHKPPGTKTVIATRTNRVIVERMTMIPTIYDHWLPEWNFPILFPSRLFWSSCCRWSKADRYDIVKSFHIIASDNPTDEEVYDATIWQHELVIKPEFRHTTFDRSPEEMEEIFQKKFGQVCWKDTCSHNLS